MTDRVTTTDLGDGGTGWRIAPNDTPVRRAALAVVLGALVVVIVVLAVAGAGVGFMLLAVLVAGVVGQPLLRGLLLSEEVRVRANGLRVIREVAVPGQALGDDDGTLLRAKDIEEVRVAPLTLKRLVGLGAGSVLVRRRPGLVDTLDAVGDLLDGDRSDDARRARARRDRRILHFGNGLRTQEADAIATRIRETLRP